MFERFTDRARRVLVLAQEEARLLNHNFIGTEHILLGLIHEGEGVAAKALESLGVSLEAVKTEVEAAIGPASSTSSGSPPFTPRAKKVLELSLREALQLGHNYIGTEHMLLGIVREGEGVAVAVLTTFGVDLNRVRRAVLQLLEGYVGSPVKGTQMTVAANRALAMARVLSESELVGTHDILLALFDQEGSAAARVLIGAGIERATVKALIDELGIVGTTDERPEAAGARTVEVEVHDDEVVVHVRDLHVAAMMRAGFGNSTGSGSPPDDDATTEEFSRIWSAIAQAASHLERRAPIPGSTRGGRRQTGPTTGEPDGGPIGDDGP